MTDVARTDGVLPPGPDDDRLLAYVLGLQADPQLEAAAAADEVLRRRLDALRAEVAQVTEQVARAVPEPSETYTDLAQPRWAALRPHLENGPRTAVWARSRALSGAPRWLRVVAPVAAVLVVLVVGVGVLQQRNAGVLTDQGDKATSDLTAPEAACGGPADAERSTAEQADVGQADLYDVVLVARARPERHGFQRFDVVRVLRGAAPTVLRLRVATRAAQAGRLHVLYLSPLGSDAGEASSAGDGSPSQSLGGDQLLFGDGGDTVLATQLPVDVDPDDIALP